MSARPPPAAVARWLPRLDWALEVSVLAFFFFLPFPRTSGVRTVALTMALVLWMVRTRTFGQPVRGAGLRLNWVIAVYAGFVLIATVISVDPVVSIKALRGDLSKFLLAYVLVVEVVRTPRQIRRLFGVSVLASTVVVAWGFAGGWTRDQVGGLAMSLPLFHNPNIIAAYLVVPTIMLIGLMVGARGAGRTLLWGGLLSAHAVMLFATGSRTAVAATILALAVFAAILVPRLKAVAFGALVAVLVVVSVAGFTQSRAPSVVARYLTLFDAATYLHKGADSSLTQRRQIWSETFTLAKEHPWAGYGYGIGLFSKVFERRNDGVYLQLGSPPHAHNVWLQTFFEIGAIGLGLFTLVVVGVVIVLWSAVRRSRTLDERVAAAVAVAGVIGIVAHSMTEGLYGSGMFGILLWGLMGTGISVSLAQRDASEASVAPGLAGVPVTPCPPCHGTEESGISGA